MSQFESPLGMVVLPYVETHLTDHCNLNCAACGHYSPIAPPWFANPDDFEQDMRRLSQLFCNIEMIRLMGGEPLLHPNVISFFAIVSRVFLASDLHLVTNGLLLERMPAVFWDACRVSRVAIDISVYPPAAKKVAAMAELVENNGLRLHAGNITTHFNAHMNFRGDSDAAVAFKACREKRNSPFLRDGRLYVCCMPALVQHFNARFGTYVPAGGGVDIYEPGLTGARANDLLNEPSPTCAHCSYDFPEFKWKTSKQSMAEWDAGMPMRSDHAGRCRS
jgi:hypothetical protein